MTCSTSNSQKTMELDLGSESIWLLLLHKIRGSPVQSAGKAMGCPSVTLETAERESHQSSDWLQFCLNRRMWMPLESQHLSLVCHSPHCSLLPLLFLRPAAFCNLSSHALLNFWGYRRW